MPSRLIIRAAILAAALSLAAPPAGAQDPDPATGQRLFRSQCGVCHSPQPGRNVIGPSLFGVVGRHSGSIGDFHYSSANRQSGLTWDPATLDRYLAAPQQVVPGTLMSFPGLKDPDQRLAVIAYLKTLQ